MKGTYCSQKDFVGRNTVLLLQKFTIKAKIARSCCEGSQVSTKASRKQGFRGGQRCARDHTEGGAVGEPHFFARIKIK